MQILSPRALNRATLARQSLLARTSGDPAGMIEHLVGLQAQAPLAPYVALWSRLAEFEPAGLAELLSTRRAVRTSLMRATIHLVSAADAIQFRGLLQAMLARRFDQSPFAKNLRGVDLPAVLARGLELLAERPLTRVELSAGLVQYWPDRDPASLAYAVTFQLPMVQIPPRGIWGSTGPVRYTPTADWISDVSTQDIPTGAAAMEALVIRYLGAFGPASVQDVQAWSGLTRLREVIDRLRPGLRTFADERGVELFDLPDAPRPDPDTPAPPRFLPEYDNLLLSHADRSRVIPDGRPVPLYPGNGAGLGTVLLDGTYRANWRLDRTIGAERLLVTVFGKLSRAERSGIAAEGRRLLTFLAPTAQGPVDIEAEGQ